ncbi:MAG: hypothetical protein JGK01_12605 [Microcoleus sp. PH2017_03_ELD_O_A]|uniref:hypothetical protein n=1 Tax=Microcoleus sp. PH2017_32_RDM_D_A TaxID=2798842 RepID=UPI001DCA7887|nr:hypothetical protein [Microcoleus sp. PH2017_32_RDM_D_A]MCC3430708.1 hypothetical protein [Microcoleus sp. PH2017_04_SCI_O_A]MCC3442612.1 hypothetical protein [Microcoleus sp. PH2017_03_ELD_O_A]MCC3510284.1 hypothetical protein [Microcoleus sp. PH2017_17_BER_D_A]MCC3564214.1 hypothetical protein [Microcoleus sp. PH2017_31_RDM_U_A]
MNGKEETENENKPEKSQNKKYKTATKTMNLYMVSSPFLLPSSLFSPSTVNYSRLSTAFLLSESTVNCQLSTVNCQLFLLLIAGDTFGSGGQLHCTGDSNGNSLVKN